jgi:hypothetical protein
MKLPRPSLPKVGRGSKNATTASTPPPAAPRPSTGAKRPGLFDTFRMGWTPPAKRRTATTASVGVGAVASGGKGAIRSADGVLPSGPRQAELSRERDELSRQFAELQWDLGGIVYEMSNRDSFKPEVLNTKVERLREVDSKLGQVERVIRLDQQGAAGTCPSCGALQARGAVYCWKCGKEQKEPNAKQPAGKSAEPAKPESK